MRAILKAWELGQQDPDAREDADIILGADHFMIKQAAEQLDEEKDLAPGSAAADLAQALPLYQDIAGPEISPSEIRAYADKEISVGKPPSKDQNTKKILRKLAEVIGIKQIPINRTNMDIIQAIAYASPAGFRWMVQNQGRRFTNKDIVAFERAAGFA